MSEPLAPLVNPLSGERLLVPKSEAERHLRSGAWRRETPAEYAEASRIAASTDTWQEQVEAGVSGFGRGVTLGASDVLARELFSPEEFQKMQDQAGSTEAGIGELAGTVLPALVSGGGTAVGRGVAGAGVRGAAREGLEAGAAGLAREGTEAVAGTVGSRLAGAASTALRSSPAGLAARGSRALGELAESGLERAGAGEMTRRMGGLAVEGATDAAVYQMGQNVSETSLGDEDLTAEKLFAGVGEQALFGGLTGGGLGLGLGAAGKAIGKTKAAIKELRANGVPDVVLDAFASASSTVGTAGTKAEVKKLISDPNVVKQWRAKDKILPEVAAGLSDSFDEMRSVQRVEKSLSAGETKAENLAKTIRRDEGSAARQFSAARSTHDELGSTLGRYETDADGIVRPRSELIDSVVGKQNAAELRAIHGRAAKAFEAAKKADDIGTASFVAAENMKRELRELRVRAAKAVSGPSPPLPTVARQLETLRDITADFEVRTAQMLEDAGTWGAAGTNQALRNQQFRQMEATREAFDAAFTRPTNAIEPGSYGGKKGRYHDAGKIRSYVNNLDNQDRRFVQRQVAEHLDARETYLAGLLDRGEVPADSIQDFKRALDATRKAKTSFSTAAQTVDNIHLMDRMLKSENEGMLSVGPVMGALAGGLVGGPIGAAASLGVAALTRPASMMRQVAVVQSMAERVKRVDDAMDGVISKHVEGLTGKLARAGRTAKTLGRGATKLAPPAFAQFYGSTAADRRGKIEKDIRQIQQLTEQPDLSISRAKSLTQGLSDSAPGVTASLALKHAKAVQFLAGKLPEGSSYFSALQPMRGQRRYTDTELEKFGRYATAVRNPRSVLRDMQSGNLSPEAVEAMREVWPRMYGELREKLITKLSKSKGDLPFAATIQLSLLLDIPGHPMLTPGFLTRQSERYEAKAAELAPAPPAPAPSNTKPKSVSNAATLSEQIAANM